MRTRHGSAAHLMMAEHWRRGLFQLLTHIIHSAFSRKVAPVVAEAAELSHFLSFLYV